MRTQTKSGNPTLLRRPIQQLHPLTMTPGDKVDNGVKELTTASTPANLDASNRCDSQRRTHPRQAAAQARDRILGCALCE